MHTALSGKSGTILPPGDIRPCPGTSVVVTTRCSWHRRGGTRDAARLPQGPGRPPRVTCPDSAVRGEGWGCHCSVWASELKGPPLHLYYSAKSVSSPQRENRRLITFAWTPQRASLGNGREAHGHRAHLCGSEHSRPSCEPRGSLCQLQSPQQHVSSGFDPFPNNKGRSCPQGTLCAVSQLRH